MLKKLFGALFHKQASIQPPSASQQYAPQDGPNLSQWYTYGAHMYRRPGDVLSVVFTNSQKNITRTIVDSEGYIRHFPGVEKQAAERVDPKCLYPRIRFRTSFSKQADSTILMCWQVQPDGRYWEDEDGYGGTSDEEICLYATIDDEGRFTGPFCLEKK